MKKDERKCGNQLDETVSECVELDLSGFGMQMQNSEVVEYYRRLENREIVINDEIDDNLIDVLMHLRRWNQEDKDIPVEECKPVRIFINSDGGVVSAAMSLIDMIKVSRTPVITIGLGRVLSAAILILISGHRRYILRHTSGLIHDGFSGVSDSIGKMFDYMQYMSMVDKQVRGCVLDSTKITPEMFDSNFRKDWYIDSDEMIRLGIADEIVTDISQII